MGDRGKEVAAEGSDGKLLLERFFWVFEEKSKRKAFFEGLREGRLVGEADSLIEKKCVDSRHCFLEEMAFCSKHLK